MKSYTVKFRPFRDYHPEKHLRSRHAFLLYCKRFYAKQLYIFELDGFAPSPCQPSGMSVGQGGNL